MNSLYKHETHTDTVPDCIDCTHLPLIPCHPRLEVALGVGVADLDCYIFYHLVEVAGAGMKEIYNFPALGIVGTAG